jgi:hypothetical protein
MLVDGERAALEGEFVATYVGEFLGQQASGKFRNFTVMQMVQG